MSSPEVAQALSDIEAAVAVIRSAVVASQPVGDVKVETVDVTPSSVTVRWSTARTDVTGWTVGRDGQDSSGTGPWQTQVGATVREQKFGLLRPATKYLFAVAPVGGSSVTATVTTKSDATPGQADPGAAHGPRALADGWVPLLRASDDFAGSAVDAGQWSMYNSVGHDGKGLRRPSQFSIVATDGALGGRALRVAGTAVGTTGGMAHKVNQKYGRWAARMRVPGGDAHYHPVLLTWPAAENWPVGGEIDFSEGKCGVNEVEFFLHYSAANKQTSGSIDVDVTQWHWWEMEFAPDGVRGWCDGKLWFEDKDTSHIPPGPMHLCVQLDWFPGSAKSTGTGEMLVDAYRVYRHPKTEG